MTIAGAPISVSRSATQKSLHLAVVSTFLALVPTAYAAFASNSVVLIADFLRCFAEFLAIFISWRIMRRVTGGDRSYYDYGFGKLEQFAGLCVACALLMSFVTVVFIAAYRIYNPVPVDDVMFGFVFALLSIGGNVFLWIYNHRTAARDDSAIADSQSRLFRAKTFASVVVAISLGLTFLPQPFPFLEYADPLGALTLGGFLLYSAIGLLSASMNDLLDCTVEEAVRLSIFRALVSKEADYLGLSFLRCRRAGREIHIELGLEFSPAAEFREVHAHMETVREEITKILPRSKVLIEPLPHL